MDLYTSRLGAKKRHKMKNPYGGASRPLKSMYDHILLNLFFVPANTMSAKMATVPIYNNPLYTRVYYKTHSIAGIVKAKANAGNIITLVILIWDVS